jgi:hypothetical protein
MVFFIDAAASTLQLKNQGYDFWRINGIFN